MNQQLKIILADMATGHWKILADKWQSQGLNGINGDSPKLRKSEELGTYLICANFLSKGNLTKKVAFAILSSMNFVKRKNISIDFF